MIDMAKQKSADYQINMFIPDLHSFTTPIDHEQLYGQIIHNAKLFAAAGLPLDNQNIHLYRQSHISAHSELTWILDCFTGFGEMNRMTEFKDKAAKLSEERVSVGLFNYPVLMAADILLYNAAYVPVGDDQRQHIEYTRDIATRMNKQFGDIFTVPLSTKEQYAFFGKDQGLRIKDLVDPTKKMSKSDESGRGVIFLGDDPKVAAKKIMSATTDDHANIRFDPGTQPGISNLLEILALLKGQELANIIQTFEGQSQYGEFKAIVAKEVEQLLYRFQATLAATKESDIVEKLEQSERTVTLIANETLQRVQRAVGLRPKR